MVVKFPSELTKDRTHTPTGSLHFGSKSLAWLVLEACMPDSVYHITMSCMSVELRKQKKTTSFVVSLMRSQVLYWAAQLLN